MSMIKRARFGGEYQGETFVQPVYPGELIKTASPIIPEVQRFVSALKPCDKFTYVLVNAMGYSEFYGSNANKDYYGYNPHLDFNGLLHDWEGIGQTSSLDRIRGKAWPHGYPCFYNAAVFAHHRNSDPSQLGFGDVVLATPNPKMKRIELVLRISNEEASNKGHTNILSRIRNGERCDVSMGAKVPFDICSQCADWDRVRSAMSKFDPKIHVHQGIPILREHQRKPIRGVARTRLEYCIHMTTMAGKVLPDGKKVFVYNDFPRFFDISFVWIGADRTARVMWHLHGDNPLQALEPRGNSTPESMLDAILSKVSHVDLRKIGEMDKEIPNGLAQAVITETDQEPTIAPEALEKLKTRCGGVKPLLSTLSAAGIVLKPEEFQRVVSSSGSNDSVILRALSSMGRVFDTDHSGVDDELAVSPGDVSSDALRSLGPLMHSRSAYSPFLLPRVHRLTIVARLTPKKELVVDTGKIATKVAALYNGYRLSTLENSPKLAEEAFPWIMDSLDEDTKYAGITGKTALALLIGTGSLVSLISAHLRRKEDAGKELGIVSKFVADHPTMTASVTAGAGLRAAMKIQAVGGVAGAAKALVTSAKAVS